MQYLETSAKKGTELEIILNEILFKFFWKGRRQDATEKITLEISKV